MVTTDPEPVFIDTNVLVYVSRPTAPQHTVAVAALAEVEASGCAVWVSPQILRAYLAVVTRPQAPAPAPPMAAAIADILPAAFVVTGEGPVVLERLPLQTHSVAGRQVHDANIVASMLVHGIARPLTFNAGDFRRFADVIEIRALAAS
jgi:predicted nucleic acid-binding protein